MNSDQLEFCSPYPNPLNDFTAIKKTVPNSEDPAKHHFENDNSDEYDTDLEVEDEDKTHNNRKRDDVAPPADVYLSTCAKYRVPPQTRISRQLQEDELNIRYRSLSTRDLAPVAVALAQSRVEKVDLRGNDLKAEGVAMIQATIALNQNITFLDLSGNDLGSSPEGAITIGNMLRHNKTLSAFHLSENHFRDSDSVYLAAGMMSNGRLETLDLSHNHFEEEGGIQFGRAIAKNNRIDILDLSWNNIRRRGAVAICKGLQVNIGIREMNLSHNGFGYEGALAAGELLAKNSMLRQLDLSSNQINWNGAAFIAKGLTKNKTLEVLRLDSNQLTTTGCMALIEATAGPSSALRILTVKNVPVIGKFESIAKDIQLRRPFYFEHGGIVSSQDVLGQRQEKQLKPMQKVIDHIKSREYRPLELFRSLDLDVDMQLTREDLLSRMKKIGASDLQKHELEELFGILQGSSSGDIKKPQSVIYRNLISSVKDHIAKQRVEKHQEQDSKERLRVYHEKILDCDVTSLMSSSQSDQLPPISSSVWSTGGIFGDSARDRNTQQVSLRMTEPSEQEEEVMQRNIEADMVAMMTGFALEKSEDSRQRFSAAKIHQRGVGLGGKNAPGAAKIMSLSTKLGAKSRPFGEATIKKKKKKKKKKSIKSDKSRQYLNEEYPEFKPE